MTAKKSRKAADKNKKITNHKETTNMEKELELEAKHAENEPLRAELTKVKQAADNKKTGQWMTSLAGWRGWI